MNSISYVSRDIKTALTLPLEESFLSGNIMKLFLKNRKAFTLAETLITLTIIGVIAAMTIPTLVNSYHKQTFVTGVKKAYAELQYAMRMVPLSENCSSGDYSCAFAETNHLYIPQWLDMDMVMKHFNVVKTTSTEEDSYCDSLISGNVYGNKCYYTADGKMWGKSTYGVIVDVNSNKTPNKLGRDRFDFVVADYRAAYRGIPAGTVIPAGSRAHGKFYQVPTYWNEDPNNPRCSTKNLGNGYYASFCTARVLEENKMNY